MYSRTVEIRMSPGNSEGDRERQKSLVAFLSRDAKTEAVTIVVDHRERGSQLVAELQKLKVCMQFKSLRVGDYVVSEDVAVERKSFEDFANSILDRRLFEQARSLKESYGRPVLLLEGRGPAKRAIAEEAIRGAIVSMVLDFGLPILWAEDAADGAKMVVTAARREQCAKGAQLSLKDRPRPKTPDGQREYVVSSLPLVESATAKKLLNEFKTVQGVFTADEKALMEVDGIGSKKARRIRELLSSPYGLSP